MTKKFLPGLLLLFLLIGLVLTNSGAETVGPEMAYSFTDKGRDATPVQLTAADGTGLKLKLYQAKTVIEGPLAFTELRLTFHNPEDRVREGRFRITLPEKAAISRFAMRIEDVWQEAEVVEKQAARRAYEDFLHRKQDPALLEQAAGNEFQARIFPIPAKADKELILSYSQELESSNAPFALKLQGLPSIQDFEIKVQVGAREEVLLQEKDFQPQGDFILRGFDTPDTLVSGGFAVTRVKAELEDAEAPLDDLLILLDTSASRALGFEQQEELLKDLVAALPAFKKLTVMAFDQDVHPIYQGSSTGLRLEGLRERGAFGATNLQRALTASTEQGHSRLLLITDGVTTAGDTSLAQALDKSKIERLDVVLVGGIRDREKMEILVDKALVQEGLVLDGELDPRVLAEKLQRTVSSGIDISVEGAAWTWPDTLSQVQDGDERLVYAQIDGQSKSLSVKVGSRTLEPKATRIADSPLLSRSAMVAQIARLEAQFSESEDPEVQEELSQSIVALSTKHRVLSSKTALLVLETDADYARFQIDRTALSDILVVGKRGLELQNRSKIYVARRPVKETQNRKKDKGIAEKTEEFTFSRQVAEPTGDAVAGLEMERDENAPTSAPPPAPPSVRRPAPRPAEPAAQEAPVPEARRNVATAGVSSGGGGEMLADEDVDMEEEAADLKKQDRPNPLTGKFAEIQALLQKKNNKQALKMARQWQAAEPGNVLALVALGDCLEASGKTIEAARVFGSIIDLFPARADLRRYAGSRLQSLGEQGLELAIDSFAKAVEQRPDHVSSHRFLAFALARQGHYDQAMEALEAGLSRQYPSGRFRSYDRILKDDLGLLAAAWLKKDRTEKTEIYGRLKKYDSKLAKEPSLRFILTWETDANDVDFHIRDGKGGHAYYSKPRLNSGGDLYGDVTTGYGPECFAIQGKPQAYPYDLEIHYYSRGPMGYGMGQLEVLEHDGKGGLSFEERPYVVMTDGAYVDLGVVQD